MVVGPLHDFSVGEGLGGDLVVRVVGAGEGVGAVVEGLGFGFHHAVVRVGAGGGDVVAAFGGG